MTEQLFFGNHYHRRLGHLKLYLNQQVLQAFTNDLQLRLIQENYAQPIATRQATPPWFPRIYRPYYVAPHLVDPQIMKAAWFGTYPTVHSNQPQVGTSSDICPKTDNIQSGCISVTLQTILSGILPGTRLSKTFTMDRVLL